MSYENFVRTKVATPVAIDATSFALFDAVAPNKLPPLDGGYLVLCDSPSNPTYIEVVKYTSRTALGLYGVTRAQEGTAARAWTGNVYAYQALMAGEANLIQTTLAGKEPTIAAGTTAQYWRGDKGWRDFMADVRAASLTGLPTSTNAVITAADTVLSGLGKLQKQTSDAATALAGNVRSTVLTGYVAGTNAALAATDTVLAAFGKIQGQLNAKANAANAALTGVPTAPTAAPGTNTLQVANAAFVQQEVAALVAAAPGALNTLDELSAAMGDDANFAASTANSLAGKEPVIAGGTNAQFWRGDKTWQDFAAAARGVALTGLSTASATAIAATDTVLGALGKLQAQITTEAASLAADVRAVVLTGYLAGANTSLAATDTVLAAFGKVQGQLNAKANAANAALTGVPTAPTAAPGTNTLQVATTAFVLANSGNAKALATATASGVLNLSTFDGLVAKVVLTENVSSIVLPAGKTGVRKELVIEFTNTGNYTVAGWPTSPTLRVETMVPAPVGQGSDVVTQYALSNTDNTGWLMHGRTLGYGVASLRIPAGQRLVAGSVNATALSTLALVAARVQYVPFTVPRPMTLSAMGVSVSTAVAGTGTLGIYDSDGNATYDYPGTLLASSTQGAINTGTTGTKLASLDITLVPGHVYFAAIVNSSAATVRAVALAGIQTCLGFTDNSTTAITMLTTTSTTNVLPTSPGAPTTQVTAIPALYLVEVL